MQAAAPRSPVRGATRRTRPDNGARRGAQVVIELSPPRSWAAAAASSVRHPCLSNLAPPVCYPSASLVARNATQRNATQRNKRTNEGRLEVCKRLVPRYTVVPKGQPRTSRRTPWYFRAAAMARAARPGTRLGCATKTLAVLAIVFAGLTLLTAIFFVTTTPFFHFISAVYGFGGAFIILLAALAATVVYSHASGEPSHVNLDRSQVPKLTDDDHHAHALEPGSPYMPCLCGCTLFLTLVVVACMLATLPYVSPELFYPTSTLVAYRLGSVASDGASFWVRDPVSTSVDLRWRPKGATSWSATVALTPNATNDYTATAVVTGLSPNSEIEWSVGEEATAAVHTFKTWPVPATPNQQYRFYVGSCQLDNFPAFTLSNAWTNVIEQGAEFALFIGDFIYADHPWIVSDNLEEYFIKYRQVLRNPAVTGAFKTIPQFYMFDDHEVINDWDQGRQGRYLTGMHAWTSYLASTNVNSPEPTVLSDYYYYFMRGDSAYFVMDTRSFRDSNHEPDSATHSMLGEQQKTMLKSWLQSMNSMATFKFIVSSVPWTQSQNTLDNEDNWGGGYLTERNEILSFIEAQGITGTIFLSADSHMSFSVELREEGSGFFEISSSPLSAFDNACEYSCLPPFHVPFIALVSTHETRRLLRPRKLTPQHRRRRTAERVPRYHGRAGHLLAHVAERAGAPRR